MTEEDELLKSSTSRSLIDGIAKGLLEIDRRLVRKESELRFLMEIISLHYVKYGDTDFFSSEQVNEVNRLSKDGYGYTVTKDMSENGSVTTVFTLHAPKDENEN